MSETASKRHIPPLVRHVRNEYLRDLREEYQLARKKEKTELLHEAVERTGLAQPDNDSAILNQLLWSITAGRIRSRCRARVR